MITYGEAHPAEWGGAYIDQEAGGLLVALFTDHIELHRIALFGQLSPAARLELRQVKRSQAELEAAKERVRADDAWFATIPADLTSLGLDTVGNRLTARVSSPNPNAAELIVKHFGWDDTMLQVSSDGTGARLLARATLRVTVVDESGNPVSGHRCVAYPDVPGATDPRPDPPLPLSDASGTCVLDVRATGYWIHIERAADASQPLAIVRAVVAPGETVAVQAVVK